MINIQYIDSINYGSVNLNDPSDGLHTTSSSSIDSTERRRRDIKSDLIQLMAIYLRLSTEFKKSIDDYFRLSPQIRRLIEHKVTHPGESQTQTAKALGISRQSLYNHLHELENIGGFATAIQMIEIKPIKNDLSIASSTNSSDSTEGI